jgi:outer membrane protein
MKLSLNNNWLLFLFFLPGFATGQETINLANAISIGLENNFSIILQKNDEQISKNNNTIGNAGFLPTLTATASQNSSYFTTHQDYYNGTTKDVKNANNNSYTATAQLNWTLFDGFSMFASKKSLATLEQMGETDTRIVLENTVSSIMLNYYGIIQLKKVILVMQNAVDLSRQRITIARAKLDFGAGSRLALLQSMVDLNTDSINLLDQITSYRNLLADFNNLLARDPITGFEINDTLIPLNDLDYTTLLSKAMTGNSEIRQARLGYDLSRYGLRGAQSYRYPTISFQAAYAYNQSNSQTGLLEYSKTYGPSFGFGASYTIFDGLNINRTIRNAKVQLNSSEKIIGKTDLTVRTQLLKAFTDYQANLKVVHLETNNREVAKENLDVAFEKYKLGSITDIELRETQKKYIDAQYQLLLAEFQAKQAEIELHRLSGTLLEVINH